MICLIFIFSHMYRVQKKYCKGPNPFLQFYLKIYFGYGPNKMIFAGRNVQSVHTHHFRQTNERIVIKFGMQVYLVSIFRKCFHCMKSVIYFLWKKTQIENFLQNSSNNLYIIKKYIKYKCKSWNNIYRSTYIFKVIHKTFWEWNSEIFNLHNIGKVCAIYLKNFIIFIR